MRINWKKYSDLYEISDVGDVRNIKTKKVLSKNKTNGNGYIISSLHGKNEYVHRLVAKLFVKNPNNKPHVNHIDTNTKNNNVNNLEWCSQKENILHSRNLGRYKNIKMSEETKLKISKKLKRTRTGKENHMSISVKCIESGKVFASARQAAQKFGRNHGGRILKVCNGEAKSAYGYTWEFIE